LGSLLRVWGLTFEQFVILCVGSDLEPDDAILLLTQPKCSIPDPYPHRIERLLRMYPLKLKAGMMRIALEQAIRGTGLFTHFGR